MTRNFTNYCFSCFMCGVLTLSLFASAVSAVAQTAAVPHSHKSNLKRLIADTDDLWVTPTGRLDGGGALKPAAPAAPQASIESQIAAAADYTTFVVPNGTHTITGPINIIGKRGLRVLCDGGGSYVGGPEHGQTGFVWNGTNGDTMMQIINSGSITIQGCFFEAKNATTGKYANVAINIDQYDPPYTPSATTSDIRLERLLIRRTDNSSAFRGVQISDIARSNCEQIRMKGLTIIASGTMGGDPPSCTDPNSYCNPRNLNRGTAIYVGQNPNAKNISLTESYWTGAVYGVRMLYGSLYAVNNESHFAYADYEITSTGEPSTIEYHVSEQGHQLARLGYGNFILRSNALLSTGYDSIVVNDPDHPGMTMTYYYPGIEVVAQGNQLLLEHNIWGLPLTAEPIGTSPDANYRPQNFNSRLVSIGNNYPTTARPKFEQFTQGWVSMMDNYAGRTPEFSMGGFQKFVLPQIQWLYGSSWSSMENGAMFYCTDCTQTNPCASGGTGAIAKRINGAWVCN